MERVQLNLERLLPELRDLEKKKIFTRKEIDEIVKRRSAFELSLIRKGSNEQDWLQYIEYEKKLELLRKIRFNKLNLKGRPTVSDYSIARHILSLYSSAVTRVPGSMKLWHSYIAHVMLNSNSTAEISRVLARAIGLHPTKADIWLLAIRFEADGTGPEAKDGGIGGGNIDSARKLVMRALRFMKAAPRDEALKIWLEWVRLEVSFMERMRKRWDILGITATMSGEQNVKPSEMDVDGAADALPDPETDLASETKDDAELAKTAGDVQNSAEKGQHAVLGGEIVRVVLDNALASASNDDITVYQELIHLLRTLPTPLRSELLSHTHRVFRTTRQGQLANPSLEAQAIYFRACSRAQDLAEPNTNGVPTSPFNWSTTLDTLEGIEAVEKGVSDFKTAIKAHSGQDIAVHEAFAGYLAEIYQAAGDDALKLYLRGTLHKIVQDLQVRGLTSAAVDSALARAS